MFEPVVDYSRHPLRRWRAAPSAKATVRLLWLTILRPLLLLVVWLVVLDYLYWEFVRATAASPNDARFLRLCAVAVLILFCVMLLSARAVRNRGIRGGARARGKMKVAAQTTAPASAIANALRVSIPSLLRWQRARKMVAIHDDDGQLRDAVVQPVASSTPPTDPA